MSILKKIWPWALVIIGVACAIYFGAQQPPAGQTVQTQRYTQPDTVRDTVLIVGKTKVRVVWSLIPNTGMPVDSVAIRKLIRERDSLSGQLSLSNIQTFADFDTTCRIMLSDSDYVDLDICGVWCYESSSYQLLIRVIDVHITKLCPEARSEIWQWIERSVYIVTVVLQYFLHK